MGNKFVIKGFDGNPITVKIEIKLYSVKDFMGQEMSGLAIELKSLEAENRWVPFGIISKSFGEYISIKNAVYIDTNNCPYAEELLDKSIGIKTAFTKSSGFCKYPLWIIDKDFLEAYGGENYQKYSREYDDYMTRFTEDTNG